MNIEIIEKRPKTDRTHQVNILDMKTKQSKSFSLITKMSSDELEKKIKKVLSSV